MSYKKHLKIILQILVTLLGVGVGVNLFTDILKEYLQNIVGKESAYKNIIFLYIFSILVLVYLIEVLFENIYNNNYNNNRKVLIDYLSQLYLKRLRKKMDTELLFVINLELRYTSKITNKKHIHKYLIDSYEDDTIQEFDTLFRDYKNKIKRLLIVGEAGSGKSVLLLNLGIKLIDDVRNDNNLPIPIIINITSWRSHYTFVNWLDINIDFVLGRHKISKKFNQYLIKNAKLILLLDGLDELPIDHRESFLTNLNNYLSSNKKTFAQTHPEVIICSRINESIKLEDSLPVRAVVVIQPLSKDQILSSLENIVSIQGKGEDASSLIRVINQAPLFINVLTTAFNVHIALKLSTYKRINLKKINAPDQLLAVFIEDQFQKVSKTYNPKKAFKWLSYIATLTSFYGNSLNFELTYIDSILLNKYYKILFRFLGILARIVATFTDGPIVGIPVWFFSRFITNDELFNDIAWYSNGSNYFNRLHTSDIIKSIGMGSVFGLFSLVGFWSRTMTFENYKENMVIGFVLGFIISLPNSLIVIRDALISRPYERFNKYWPMVLMYVSWFIIIGAVINILAARLPFDLASTSIFIKWGLITSILASPLMHHIILRFFLFLQGSLPLFLGSFMNNFSKETGLIETDGGKWRFRHQLILEYLKKNSEKF